MFYKPSNDRLNGARTLSGLYNHPQEIYSRLKYSKSGGGGDRVPSCRHRAGGVGQFLAGMQFSTKVLKCVVIC